MKLNKLQQLLVGVAAIILVAVIVEFFVLKEDKRTIQVTKDEIAQLEKKISIAKAIKQAAEELQEEMNHLKAQLERLKRVLPLEVNKPKFMADIKRYANENGVEIIRVSNNLPHTDDVIVEHPFTYTARGNYHDFGRFFAQLTNYPYIINIKGLYLSRNAKDQGYNVEGSFIISVYTYKEPSEEELRTQIQTKKEERKGRNRKNT